MVDQILFLLELNALIVIVLLIREERDPSTTLAWAFALLLFPGVGLVAYLLFGTNRRVAGQRDRIRREALRRAAVVMEALYGRFHDRAMVELAGRSASSRRLSTALTRQCGTRMLPCEDLEVFTSGEHKFARLLDDIESAQDSIHLQYFIWEDDILTRRICDALERKVAEGVEVRILYDWVGSLFHSKGRLKALAQAGAAVRSERPHLTRLNYRDHRKVAIFDGVIGYTGGMNAGQEYVDGGSRFATWRDTHCRFTGPLVAELQRVFTVRWFRITGEDLFDQRRFPDIEITGDRPVWSQLGHSGPESEWRSLRNAFLIAIAGAERHVRVQSPYFVPDEATMEALVTQALAGVDVRFMMTGVPDKRTAWHAAFSYIDEFIAAGGRMLHYTAGFFHPKTLTVDGRVAVIGTANFDIRSFDLHDEIALFFFDPATARELDDIFDADARDCRSIDPDYYARMGRAERFFNALMRLWSRLL